MRWRSVPQLGERSSKQWYNNLPSIAMPGTLFVVARFWDALIDPFVGAMADRTRSRWGSCASDGSLAFSWRLVMTPEFVQDYVAAHEVAHLKHLNHGARFWSLVDKLTPHAEAAIPWLRAEGFRLLRVG